MSALPTYSEAHAQLIAAITPLTTETVPLREAHGRTLRTTVCLKRDQPPFDRATMDGYAVAAEDERTTYRIVGSAQAGAAAEVQPQPGEAVAISTGSPTPSGTSVVPIERCTVADDNVTIDDPTLLAKPLNIAWRGEDGRTGEVVVPAGTRLGPQAIAAAAMAGAVSVDVTREPRVAVIVTGDEVGRDDEDGIADSNGPLLAGILRGIGLDCRCYRALDEADATEQTMRDAAADADLVITTGGVSVGPRDLVRPTAEKLGWSVLLHGIGIQPGKPVLIATKSDGPLLIGLPGNPVSVLATAHLFAWPAIAALRGSQAPAWRSTRAAAPLNNRKRRHIFLPGVVDETGVRGVAWHGSGDLLAAATANCLINLPVGCDFNAGDEVQVLPLIASTGDQLAVLPASRT